MKLSGFVLAVFALLAIFGVSSSSTTHKPTTRKPQNKPTKPKPVVLATTIKPQIDCTEYKVCTNAVKPIWATDGTTCVVYRNKCFFENQFCALNLQNLNVIKEVSKQVCIPLCNDKCHNNIDLKCGELNGQFKTFINPCYMESYACKTGETFLLADVTKCGIDKIEQTRID